VQQFQGDSDEASLLLQSRELFYERRPVAQNTKIKLLSSKQPKHAEFIDVKE
jgi:hypothetical protein